MSENRNQLNAASDFRKHGYLEHLDIYDNPLHCTRIAVVRDEFPSVSRHPEIFPQEGISHCEKCLKPY